MKVGDIYRTCDPHNNTIHWRINGDADITMLCKRGNFLEWAKWHCIPQKDTVICQECEVQYVLEIMK